MFVDKTKVAFTWKASNLSEEKAKERAFRAALLRIKRNPAAGPVEKRARGRKPRIIYGHGVMACADVIFPRCLMAARIV